MRPQWEPVNVIFLVSFHCSLSILYASCSSSFSCLDCVPVCVSVCFVFSSAFHYVLIYLPALWTLLFSFLFCHPVHWSFSLWTTFSICVPTVSLSVCLVFLFICSLPASGLCSFSFSVSVFLQLSEFLSFCKSLCPYLSFSNIISNVCIYVHLCVCVCECSHCVHEHVWSVLVCLLYNPRLGACVPALYVWITNHHGPSVWGVKYFSVMKYISVLIIFDFSNRYWEEAANNAVKTSSISQN